METISSLNLFFYMIDGFVTDLPGNRCRAYTEFVGCDGFMLALGFVAMNMLRSGYKLASLMASRRFFLAYRFELNPIYFESMTVFTYT